MKPLLEASLWTDEDQWVWNRQALQGRFYAVTPEGKYFDWLGHYQTADRRDAALMLGYERAKANLITRDGLQSYLRARAMVNEMMSALGDSAV